MTNGYIDEPIGIYNDMKIENQRMQSLWNIKSTPNNQPWQMLQ